MDIAGELLGLSGKFLNAGCFAVEWIMGKS